MSRTGLLVGMMFSIALGSTACSRTADERAAQQEAALAARDGAPGEEVTITGCLTAAPDRGAFVVTADRNALTSGALHAGSGETPTYTYELTGNTANLTAHVGQQVQVKGRVDNSRKDEVDVEAKDKAKLPPTQSGNEKVTPAIETNAEMEINVRRLQVSSVSPTGRGCAATGQ